MQIADDTKIWRKIKLDMKLQSDINYIFDWAVKNKMKFTPSKCKVLKIFLLTSMYFPVSNFSTGWTHLTEVLYMIRMI